MRNSKRAQNRILSVCGFGRPDAKTLPCSHKKYLEAQPDFLELGIPFSDPIADGPTIQAADERALKAGVTPKKAIELVKKIRAMIQQHNRDIPIGILAYSNIVLRYGIQKFYRDLKQAGADSILIADVPLEEIKPFAKAAKKHKIHQIFLVSEYTDNARLKKIEKIASGFLYAVSVLGITGARKELSKSTLDFVRRLKTKTRLPIMVGFGISSRDHINALQKSRRKRRNYRQCARKDTNFQTTANFEKFTRLKSAIIKL